MEFSQAVCMYLLLLAKQTVYNNYLKKSCISVEKVIKRELKEHNLSLKVCKAKVLSKRERNHGIVNFLSPFLVIGAFSRRTLAVANTVNFIRSIAAK